MEDMEFTVIEVRFDEGEDVIIAREPGDYEDPGIPAHYNIVMETGTRHRRGSQIVLESPTLFMPGTKYRVSFTAVQ